MAGRFSLSKPVNKHNDTGNNQRPKHQHHEYPANSHAVSPAGPTVVSPHHGFTSFHTEAAMNPRVHVDFYLP
jgi:hypothetical protein